MKRPNHSHVRPETGVTAFVIGTGSGEAPADTVAIRNETPADDARGFLLLGDLIIPLSQEKKTVVGRDSTVCHVVLADPRVSKMHTTIYYAGERYFLKDLGSLNGCRINGCRVADSHSLVAGDTLEIPPYTMEFVGVDHPRIQQVSRVEDDDDAGETPRPGHFAGQLNILSITDLIQLLNSTRQSGALTITHPERDAAVLYLHQGEILQASWRDDTGESAVYEVLGMIEGHFEFTQGNPPIPGNPLQIPTLTLLLDGCRIMDEGGLTADTVELSPVGQNDPFATGPAGLGGRLPAPMAAAATSHA